MLTRSLLVFVAFVSIPHPAWPQGGDPLGPEFRVNTYTTGKQSRPSVASDANGNFVVAWLAQASAAVPWTVVGQRYASSGAPLGGEFRVNTSTNNPAGYGGPAVAADAAGDFVVVWMTMDTTASWDMAGQRFSSSGNPLGPEFRVNTYTTGYQGEASVASDASGNFVVVWSSTHDGGGVFGQRYASSGAPLGTEFRVNIDTAYFQGQEAVASDGPGNFVVVWMTSDGYFGPFNVLGRRYGSSGAPLGAPFRVNTSPLGSYLTFVNPSAAHDAAGDFVVVWTSEGLGDPFEAIFGQRYASSGAPLGAEFRVNSYTTTYQTSPVIAGDALGGFVVVWQSFEQDGSRTGIFGQRWASGGSPLGPEFRVSTYTSLEQWFPAVAADATGNFVVVWESWLQDGSLQGAFGQRYGPIVPVGLTHFRVE
jgi:hypothetical protein